MITRGVLSSASCLKADPGVAAQSRLYAWCPGRICCRRASSPRRLRRATGDTNFTADNVVQILPGCRIQTARNSSYELQAAARNKCLARARNKDPTATRHFQRINHRAHLRAQYEPTTTCTALPAHSAHSASLACTASLPALLDSQVTPVAHVGERYATTSRDHRAGGQDGGQGGFQVCHQAASSGAS